MKYKLIACDFDGTMYGGRKPEIPEENKKAIDAYREAGGRFIFSTGRMYRSIRPYAKELGLTGEIIVYQGAAVYDIETGEKHLELPLPTMDAVEILKFFEAKKCHCQIYYNDIYYVVEENEFVKHYVSYCGIPMNLTGKPLSEYVIQCEIEPIKIMAIADSSIMDKLKVEAEETFRDKGKYGFAQSSGIFLEVTSVKANKGVALKFLAERYGVAREETLAIGDSSNDIAMIRYAGLGVAVDNAMPELKREADYIGLDAGENAVADIIYKVMRDEI
jgi:Cof subfamily protein (haloacid dehalogenase superfamily)